MSIIDYPAGIPLRATMWQQSGGVIRNRSAFTGRTRDIRLGPSARWTCKMEFIPTNDTAALNLLREFLADASQPGAGFRLPAVEAAQAGSPVPATCLVNGGSQLGQTLNVDGLPNSTAILSAGALVSIALPNSDEQLCVLTAAATSNGSGQVALALGTPLRASPADNAVVKLHTPTGLMRLGDDAVNWLASPGGIYTFEALDAEEWF